MIGRTLARFQVTERLGAGGMGVVYRGWDPHLERDVALKLLPEGALAGETGRARFRREALALSRLHHASIGAVYDFDTQDGVDFLVMEYVPGTTLAQRLEKGPLEEREVISWGLQVAEALESAHEQGVVHRDLKPANVMVTPQGRLKVLDFGLAKLRTPEAAGTALTQSFGMVGTLPYASPEQLLGSEVDARADLFALGAMLYEMATGRQPFSAAGPMELMGEILHKAPPTPSRIRPGLSRELEAVIFRCLEKDPGRRYGSAAELAADLRRIGARSPLGPAAERRIESIAVLPLENLSRDPDQEYFADGMTEALTADLARIGALQVISRTSAMRYKNTGKPLPEIARELGVDAVVEGSVLKVGDRVRITAQLIEAATDRHLWAERYERDVSDVLGIQSEVAQAVAREIHVQLTGQERARLARLRRIDPEAHEAYLKGRYFWSQRTLPSLEKALEQFQRAIEKDPAYARAFSGLADSYNILGDNNWQPPEVAFPRARAAALRALELDEDLAEAHTSLAYVTFAYEWEWKKAESEYRRAIELDRGYTTAHQWYGIFLASQRRFDEGIAHTLEAMRRDPLSFILYASAGDTCFYARRFDEAIDLYRRGVELAPAYGPAYMDLGRALEQSGRLEESLETYQKGLERTGGNPAVSPALGCVYALMGRESESRAIVAAMEERALHSHVPAYAIASVHALLGDTETALGWLEKAHATRDRAMVYLQVNPRFDRLRGEPRFRELVRKMAFL